MTTTDFKPCPHCGERNLTTLYTPGGARGWIEVVNCRGCKATAPAAVWDQRSPMAEVAEIMKEVEDWQADLVEIMEEVKK